MNIVELLNEKKLTISSAESFTGGLFSAYITSIPNASKCFKGGVNCYSAESKINVLGVKKETIEKFGTISFQCCQEMLDNAVEKFNSDIALAFTGNAGPSASEDKQVGLVYIGIKFKGKSDVFEYYLNGSRDEIRNKAIELAKELIIKNI